MFSLLGLAETFRILRGVKYRPRVHKVSYLPGYSALQRLHRPGAAILCGHIVIILAYTWDTHRVWVAKKTCTRAVPPSYASPDLPVFVLVLVLVFPFACLARLTALPCWPRPPPFMVLILIPSRQTWPLR